MIEQWSTLGRIRRGLGGFSDVGVVLLKLQVGQVKEEQQLDALQSDIGRVIGRLRDLCAVNDGKGTCISTVWSRTVRLAMLTKAPEI